MSKKHKNNSFKSALKNPLEYDIKYFYNYIFPKNGNKEELSKFITTCIANDILEIDNIFHIPSGIIFKHHGIYQIIFDTKHGRLMSLKMPTSVYTDDEDMLKKLCDISKRADDHLSKLIKLLDARFFF